MKAKESPMADNHSGAPMVSIIVPNFNHEKFLPLRLESIFSQTFTDYELILLDDCSTDGSRKMISDLAEHPKVSRVVLNDTNSGSPFRQWMKGITLARGKYIWIAESDDFCREGFLQRTVELLERHGEAVLAFAGAEVYDEEGRLRTNSYNFWEKRHLAKKEGYGIYPWRDYLMHNMYWACTIYNASAVLFRRDAFDPSMLEVSMTMRNSGDYMFWCNLVSKGYVIEIYENLNCYREHLLNTTVKGRHNGTMWIEDIKVLRRIEQLTDMPVSRRRLRHGVYYKGLMRSAMPVEVQQQALAEAEKVFGPYKKEFAFYRRYKIAASIFPWLIQYKHDRL